MTGPFALPVARYRVRRARARARARARSSAPGRRPSPEAPESETAPSSSSSSRLPPESINPRSHGPATLRQFVVAGLAPELEVPSRLYPRFPHQALPDRFWRDGGGGSRSATNADTSGSEAEAEAEAEAATAPDNGGAVVSRRRLERNPAQAAAADAGRVRALSKLMAVLHRYLHEGKMGGAKRAYGILLRAPYVDQRQHDLWRLGVEILMRDGEEEEKEKEKGLAGHEAPDARTEDTDTDEDADSAIVTSGSRPARRWGSAANMEKTRTFLMHMISQHPYDPSRPRLVSAWQFWPALFSIEIYNVDAEYRISLHRLDREAVLQQDDAYATPSRSEDGSQSGDDPYAAVSAAAAAARHQASSWAAKDELRRETRTAAEHVATRMDETMESSVRYGKHHELLRLRGMLALYIADLCLPARCLEMDLYQTRKGLALRLPVHGHVGTAEEEHVARVALRERAVEMRKAKTFFQTLVDNKAGVDNWVREFLDTDEDADEEDE